MQAGNTGIALSVQPGVLKDKEFTVTAYVYNEAGEVVKTLYDMVDDPVGDNMINVNLSATVIEPGYLASSRLPSQEWIAIQTSGMPVTLMWDGTNDLGTVVTPGIYEIEIHWNDGSGQTERIQARSINARARPVVRDRIAITCSISFRLSAYLPMAALADARNKAASKNGGYCRNASLQSWIASSGLPCLKNTFARV